MTDGPQAFFGGHGGLLIFGELGRLGEWKIGIVEAVAILDEFFIHQCAVRQINVAQQAIVAVAVGTVRVGLQADFATGGTDEAFGVGGGIRAEALHRRVRFVSFGRVDAHKANGLNLAIHVYGDGIAIDEMVDAIQSRLVGLDGLAGILQPATILGYPNTK